MSVRNNCPTVDPKVTATLRGEQLVVSSNGYKENDFNVTFDATENDNSGTELTIRSSGPR